MHRFGSITLPSLARSGEGADLSRPPAVHEPSFEWAKRDSEGLRAAARKLVERRPIDDDLDALRLQRILTRDILPIDSGGRLFERLLHARPEALLEAVAILIQRADDLRNVMTRHVFTDPATIGGYLDRQFGDGPAPPLAQPRAPWNPARLGIPSSSVHPLANTLPETQNWG